MGLLTLDDTESGAVQRGIRYLLPNRLKDAQRDDGSIDRVHVMQSAVWSPSAVPALMRMRRRVQKAAEILVEHVPAALRHREWEEA